MDLSGNTFGLGANVPFSTAHFDEADAGAGAFQHLRSGLENVVQHQMNASVRANPDARDTSRSWSTRLTETTNRAVADLMAFLRKDVASDADAPCVEQHRQFLRGLDTPGFVASPSWMARNIRSVVDHDAIMTDISGSLGMSVPTLRETIHTTMELYVASLGVMDGAYSRLQTKLKEIEDFTSQVKALRPPNGSSPEHDSLQSALSRFVESRYAALRIDEDYTEFATNYDRFQAYRSILGLLQSRSTEPTCTVCMTEPISAAVIPCGHTFCNNCCKTQRSFCYICRTPVRDRQRLYFG